MPPGGDAEHRRRPGHRPSARDGAAPERRQVTELIFLSGLAASAPPADLNTNKNFPTTTISVAGGQANGISFIMDGATHNDPFNNLNLPTPFPDAIQEFKVETSALPARYGHHAASTVNVVTQSGSNKVTADVFEFLRNYRFNARNFFAPRATASPAISSAGRWARHREEQALLLRRIPGPHRAQQPGRCAGFVPTQAMRNGDFTAFASPACNGGRQVNLGAPFVNNRVGPVALEQRRQQLPEVRPRRQRPLRLASLRDPEQQHRAPGIAKLDYTINDRQSAFVRYFYAVYDNPATYDGQNVLTLSRPGRTTRRTRSSARTTGRCPHTLQRAPRDVQPHLNDRPCPDTSLPPSSAANRQPVPRLHGVTVTGNGFSVGFGAVNPGYFDSKSIQVADDLDFIRGKHQISVGANWIHTSIA
jgi:hypothetical protein